MNPKVNHRTYNALLDEDSKMTLPKKYYSVQIPETPRALDPSLEAKKKVDDYAAQKILGIVPGTKSNSSQYKFTASAPSANVSRPSDHIFSHSPAAGMDRINSTLFPMTGGNATGATGGGDGSELFPVDGAALYDHYRDLYERQGRLAREDAEGKLAAMTGGQSSSYGTMAGEQTYDAYLDEYESLLRQAVGKDAEEEGDTWWTEDSFTGTTKQEAEAYLVWQGVPTSYLSELMSPGQWVSAKEKGGGGAETEFASYAEYLSAFVEYAMETYGG